MASIWARRNGVGWQNRFGLGAEARSELKRPPWGFNMTIPSDAVLLLIALGAFLAFLVLEFLVRAAIDRVLRQMDRAHRDRAGRHDGGHRGG